MSKVACLVLGAAGQTRLSTGIGIVLFEESSDCVRLVGDKLW